MADYVVKICGVCRPQDARLASEAGADYVGVLVDVPGTPRSRAMGEAMEIAAATTVPLVVLLWMPSVEEAREAASALRPRAIQLLADEPPELLSAIRVGCRVEVWKAVHLPARGTGTVDVDAMVCGLESYAAAGAERVVLDAKAVVDGRERRGGTGQASDWTVAAELVRRSPCPVLLAGGITPENAAEAIRVTQPAGVDVSSGVESHIGEKDPEKVRAIIERVHSLGRA